MSRVKNTSSSNASSNLNNVDTSQTVTSAANAELFSGLFEQMDVENQFAHDQKREDGQNAKDQAREDDRKVGAATRSGKATEARDADKDKVKKAEDADKVAKDEAAEDAEAEQLADEADKISVEELSRQLGVILNTFGKQAVTEVEKVNPAQTLNLTAQGPVDTQALQNAIQQIPQEILRKVDVRSLSDQLGKIMKGEEVLEVEVPSEDLDLQGQMLGSWQQETEKTRDEGFQANLIQTGDLEIKQIQKEIKVETTTITPQMMISAQVDVEATQREQTVDVKVDADRQTLSTGLDDLNAVLKGGEEFKIKISQSQFQFNTGETEKVGLQPLETVTEHLDLSSLFKDLSMPTGNERHPVSFHQATPPPAPPVTVTAPEVEARLREKVEQVIMGMAKNGKPNVTRIQLHPEHLGRIDIQLEVKDKLVKASVVTDSAETRDAILKHLPQIREILAADNMTLDQFSAQHDRRHFDNSSLPQYFSEGQRREQRREQNQTYGSGSGVGHDKPENKTRSVRMARQGNARVNITV